MAKKDVREKAPPAGAEEGPGFRAEGFVKLAKAVASGEATASPKRLTGHDRRLHVRQTLREDHQTRIQQHSQGAFRKFEKLDGSLFSFFRGTALLFYRDMAGEDAWMPTVLVLGDVHPENFGIMPNANNVPIFAVNDFDEACYAPFTWDLKRGATGFMIAADEIGGFSAKRRRKIAAAFVKGYANSIRRYAEDSTEREHELRYDNSPPLLRDLFESAAKERSEWLAKKYLDEFGREFRPSKKITPISTRRDEFQKLVDQLIKENEIEVPERAGEMRVKDVAVRRDQGTASLGLSRYYVLIEGPEKDGSDDLIIEFKRARRSALAGLTPPSRYMTDGQGDRIVHAQGVQLVRGDIFYGHVEFEGKSFMSRERAPFRDDVDLDDLSKDGWMDYAAICGRTLAHAHALSDEIGKLDYDVEPKIVEAIEPQDLFVQDIVAFAEEAAERVEQDHAFFKADHALGAFSRVDVVYK